MLTKLGKLMVSTLSRTGNTDIILKVGTANNCNLIGKSAAGNTFYCKPFGSSQGWIFRSAAITETGSAGVYLGSGTTPATENDYTLESVLTGLTATSSENTYYDSETYKYRQSLELTVSNNTGAEVTVGEIGRFVEINTSATRGATSSGNTKLFMVDRTVLETPVVIPSGESSIVRYEFEYPTSEV